MTADPFALPMDTSTPQGPTVDLDADLPKPDKAPGESKPDTKPKRPTTRAERAAVAAANKAKREATKPKGDKMPAGKSAPRRASLEQRLGQNLASVGTMVMVAGAGTGSAAVQADGLVIVSHSGNIAAALDKVAKDDPRVAAALERMLTAGTWSGLIAAMLPVAVAIAANHGAIPPHIAAMIPGVTPDAQAATSEPGGVGIA